MSFYVVAQSDPDRKNNGQFICKLNKTLQFDTDYDVAITGINRYAKYKPQIKQSPARTPGLTITSEYPKISANKDIVSTHRDYITRLTDPTWAIKDEDDDFDISLYIGGADGRQHQIKIFQERCIRKSHLNTFEKTFDDHRLIFTEMDKLFKVKLEFVGRPLTRPPIHETITTPYFLTTSKPSAASLISKTSTSTAKSTLSTYIYINIWRIVGRTIAFKRL